MAQVLSRRSKQSIRLPAMRATALVVVALFGLSACGHKEKTSSGQSLVRVDGQEITVSQLNAELARAGVAADKKDVASKQLLEMLINQQLIDAAAAKDKLDRDPAVMSAIERARAQIIAQAFMQKRLAQVGRPTKEEIDKYYADHPDLFAERKQFEMDQLLIASKDFNADMKALMVPSRTLDEMITWMKEHHVEFTRSTNINSSVAMPEQLVKKLKEMHKGQVFALQEADKTLIVAVKNVKDDPAKPEAADPQIAKFLLDQRNKDASQAEITRLRATAKIDYLNKNQPAKADAAPADATKKDGAEEHLKKGVADL